MKRDIEMIRQILIGLEAHVYPGGAINYDSASQSPLVAMV